jgi:hypothetical protein
MSRKPLRHACEGTARKSRAFVDDGEIAPDVSVAKKIGRCANLAIEGMSDWPEPERRLRPERGRDQSRQCRSDAANADNARLRPQP